LRMFIEPTLVLNTPLLKQHLENVKTKKEKLLEAAATDKEVLMSNDKFAQLLISLGVDPPKKISTRTGKEAWAFAKTDEGFKALAEHFDPRVQTLVGARLGTKTTLEETRTQRFIDISERGPLPVPIKYYAAHTGRWGGDAVTTPAQDESAKKAEAINYDADAIALRTQIDIAREELSRKTLEASEANSVFGKESMEAKKAADAVAKANKEYNDRVDAAKETGYIPPVAYLLQEQMLSQEGKAKRWKGRRKKLCELALPISSAKVGKMMGLVTPHPTRFKKLWPSESPKTTT